MDGMQAAAQALQAYSDNPQTAKAVGDFAKEYFGGVGHNLVGLLGGDWLFHARLENIARLAHGVNKRLEKAGVQKPAHVSVALGLPLLKSAADENREELVDMWERLMAAAMNPTRMSSVRRSFIDVVSDMEPLDALIMNRLGSEASILDDLRRIANHHSHTNDGLDLTIANLKRLGLVTTEIVQSRNGFGLTGFGRELYRVIKD